MRISATRQNRDTTATRVYYNLIFNDVFFVCVSKFHRQDSHREDLKDSLPERKIIHNTKYIQRSINKHRLGEGRIATKLE